MIASLPASRFRSLRALLLGSPEALTFFIAAKRSRPAGGGGPASLAGDGFVTSRRRSDLHPIIAAALALGFAIPILAIVIIRHAGG